MAADESQGDVLVEFKVVRMNGQIKVNAEWPQELGDEHLIASAAIASAVREYRDTARQAVYQARKGS